MGRTGNVGGVTLFVRERFDCTLFTVSGDVVELLGKDQGVVVGDCIGHSDDKTVEFKIFSEITIKDSNVATLAF